tara:strand:- start:119 stop:1264 length:1146 start_codon:yes stop_codon:yes gene_type:complete
MIGGNLLSEGGFGCVYHPSITCKGEEENSKNFVSKIQKYNKSARNEIKISEILKEVPGYKNFFALIIKNCSIDIGKIKKNERNQCRIFKKYNDSKFILLKMHYIKGDIFVDYLANNKNNNENINNLINNYNHILSSISLLIDKKIVHFDIKNENILFNEVMKIPIILDFGISIIMDNLKFTSLKDTFYTYAPEYYIWPLEVHYLCYLINENDEPNIDEIIDIVESCVNNNKGLSLFSPTFIKKYKKSAVNQLIKYNNKKYNDRIKLLLDYWKTWDNYSLSIVYLRYIRYISGGKYFNNEFIVFFSKILLQNIHPNPDKRYSVVDTIITFNKFLNKDDLKNVLMYQDLINIYSSNKKNSDESILNINNDLKLTRKIYNDYNN